jgi:hypothetical protein
MNLAANPVLASVGHQLDTSERSFGELRESSYLVGDPAALRERFAQDGYLFLRGFLPAGQVLAARRPIVEALARENLLEPGTDPMDAIMQPGKDTYFRADLAETNQPLKDLLYGRQVMGFYGDFFGEKALHYDFTWLRVVAPGRGSAPHCDMAYMGRGEREKLMTAWTPLGRAPLHVGGLMILEDSHRQKETLKNYLSRDVDTYCTNGRHAAEIESGRKQWSWNGVLSNNPASLREKLGGRWLTTEYEPGDFLTFSMCTIHASIDNKSDQIRLSSDSRYQPASRPVDERWVGEKPAAHGLAGKRGRVC